MKKSNTDDSFLTSLFQTKSALGTEEEAHASRRNFPRRLWLGRCLPTSSYCDRCSVSPPPQETGGQEITRAHFSPLLHRKWGPVDLFPSALVAAPRPKQRYLAFLLLLLPSFPSVLLLLFDGLRCVVPPPPLLLFRCSLSSPSQVIRNSSGKNKKFSFSLVFFQKRAGEKRGDLLIYHALFLAPRAASGSGRGEGRAGEREEKDDDNGSVVVKGWRRDEKMEEGLWRNKDKAPAALFAGGALRRTWEGGRDAPFFSGFRKETITCTESCASSSDREK